MAQDLSPKQVAFVSRYVGAVAALIASINTLADLKTEWDADAYATGATPTGNNLTDDLVQRAAPYATALQINQAVGAVESIRTTVAANRGYLEAMRP